MIQIVLPALIALVLAACQPEAEPEVRPDWQSMSEDELAAACGAEGGVVTRGLAGYTCAMPEPDAGQACTHSGDCSGLCLADSRTCSPVRPFFGCHELYEHGQIQAICID